VTDPLDLPLMAEYAAYHRDKRNRLCHEFGIPMIVLAIIVLMRLAHYGPVDLAMVAILALSFYYASLVKGAALGAIVGLVVLYAVATLLTWPIAIGLFVAGWILQFVGHAYEGKKPAFLTNLVHLLIGPLWIALLLSDRRASEATR
jgi:uncharacterized membrane protein YGL010W